MHHDITRKVRAEALELLKRNPDPSFSDIESLSYLNNFVRESLRIYCPGKSYPDPLDLAPINNHRHLK